MLKKTLFNLPLSWQLTPVRSKAAYFSNWTKKGVDRAIIGMEIDNGATGFGLLTGILSGGIMAIDCDGSEPHALFRKLLMGDIPNTVAFTSGRKDRAQYLFYIPQTDWGGIKTKKQSTGGEMLEFRWNGQQSVLPPSKHPETGSYKWLNSPAETTIAIIPPRILEYLNLKPLPPSSHPRKLSLQTNSGSMPIERCLSRTHRTALDSGVTEGSRHNMAVSLSRDLLGTRDMLDRLGVNYLGDPETMFNDFCSRCSPPLPDRERQQVWRSATSGSFTPSIDNDVVFQRCINSWNREQKVPVSI